MELKVYGKVKDKLNEYLSSLKCLERKVTGNKQRFHSKCYISSTAFLLALEVR